eukprot:14756512-Alexandrium_andersonii.AAC.1
MAQGTGPQHSKSTMLGSQLCGTFAAWIVLHRQHYAAGPLLACEITNTRRQAWTRVHAHTCTHKHT